MTKCRRRNDYVTSSVVQAVCLITRVFNIILDHVMCFMIALSEYNSSACSRASNNIRFTCTCKTIASISWFCQRKSCKGNLDQPGGRTRRRYREPTTVMELPCGTSFELLLATAWDSIRLSPTILKRKGENWEPRGTVPFLNVWTRAWKSRSPPWRCGLGSKSLFLCMTWEAAPAVGWPLNSRSRRAVFRTCSECSSRSLDGTTTYPRPCCPPSCLWTSNYTM